MKLAVTYENGEIYQHFGHTPHFELYDIQDGKVADSRIVDTGDCGHSALAKFLSDRGVDALICGGIGDGAQAALKQVGIEFYGGVTGRTDEAVAEFLAGTLKYDPNVRCSHHDQMHGGEKGGHHSCSGDCSHS